MKEDNAFLKKENDGLRAEVTDLNVQIETLNKLISNLRDAKVQQRAYEEISDTSKEVLKRLFYTSEGYQTALDVSEIMSLVVSEVRYHLDILSDKQLVMPSGAERTDDGEYEPKYILTPRGRKYVVEFIGIGS